MKPFLLALIVAGYCTSAPAAPVAINPPQPRHGLHFTTPVTTWDEAIPLGNGLLGALVWGDGHPLKISLDRTDLWDLTAVPEFHSAGYTYSNVQRLHASGQHQELVRLLEAPYERPAPTKIPAGRIELAFEDARFQSTDLSLVDATGSVQLAPGTDVHVFIHATQPVGLIRIHSPRHPVPRLIAPPFGGRVTNAASGGIGAGDLAQLGYPPPVASAGRDWQAFSQTGAQGFRFAVHLAWKAHAGEWLGAWSVASSATASDPAAAARQACDDALRQGFVALQRSHQEWWNRYWNRSSITVPNAVIERQWFLDTYKFGAATRRGAPPITLQGPWTADNGQLPPWKGDYHHDLNTQLSYWPCYSGNRLDEGLAYLDWLWNTRSNCIDWTRRFFGLPGMNVPMTTDLANNQIGGWRQYTHSTTTAAWLAHHFYLHWRYSQDRTFLAERAWPYLRDASVFGEAVTSTRDAKGKRSVPLSASPEIHDNRPQAWFRDMTNYDLALFRWLFNATAELADELQRPDEARHWRAVAAELPDFALGDDGRLLVAPGEPLRESHRHFSHLMALHPLGLIDVRDGPGAKRTVDAGLAELDRLRSDYWCGYSFAWLGSLAARARDGDRAARALETFATAFTLRNSLHCNGDQSGRGFSKMTYRPFTLEGNFAAAAGTQEMLLQSHRGRIELFPAIPPSWRDASFTTLRAEGAFLVSAERRDGQVRRIDIVSEKGGLCRVLSPWSDSIHSLSMKPGQRWTITGEQDW